MVDALPSSGGCEIKVKRGDTPRNSSLHPLVKLIYNFFHKFGLVNGLFCWYFVFEEEGYINQQLFFVTEREAFILNSTYYSYRITE